jgi:hypothetical protein
MHQLTLLFLSPRLDRSHNQSLKPISAIAGSCFGIFFGVREYSGTFCALELPPTKDVLDWIDVLTMTSRATNRYSLPRWIQHCLQYML